MQRKTVSAKNLSRVHETQKSIRNAQEQRNKPRLRYQHMSAFTKCLSPNDVQCDVLWTGSYSMKKAISSVHKDAEITSREKATV